MRVSRYELPLLSFRIDVNSMTDLKYPLPILVTLVHIYNTFEPIPCSQAENHFFDNPFLFPFDLWYSVLRLASAVFGSTPFAVLPRVHTLGPVDAQQHFHGATDKTKRTEDARTHTGTCMIPSWPPFFPFFPNWFAIWVVVVQSAVTSPSLCSER